MAKDLRSFLHWLKTERPEWLLEIDKPIKTEYEITALQHKLERDRQFPVILANKPITFDGRESEFRLVTNLTASRILGAELFGLDPRRIAMDYSERLSRREEPVEVSRDEAPVKECVDRGDDVDLLKFPFTVHNYLDPGPYLGSGFVTTADPDTGIDNCALQRMWIKERNRTGLWPATGSHNLFNIEKAWSRGEDLPAVVWVGHHPTGLAGAQTRLQYPVSHYPAMGGALGEPVRLVASELYGRDLMVPADAEIVIEGRIPKDVYETEGPFGEYPGYVGPQRPSQVFEVECVTYRRDAILHDIGVGGADHLMMLGNFPLEARAYEVIKQSIPELVNVHVPMSGRRFHCYVQVRKRRPGVGKAALLAALPVDTRFKHVFVVDEDIDIFDDSQVMWAIGSRTQWDRDVVIVKEHSVFPLDPSLSAPGAVGTVGGIDATLPPPLDIGMPRQFQVVNKVPDAVEERIQVDDFVSPEERAKFPTSF